MGEQEGGARKSRLYEEWAKTKSGEVTFGNYATEDKGPKSSIDAHSLVTQFAKSVGNRRSLIAYQGHGRESDGGWSCHKGTDFKREAVTPAYVKDAFETAGAPMPTIITGSCYGGKWLEVFDGLSGAEADSLNFPPFGNWLLEGGPFPTDQCPERGGPEGGFCCGPLCRGIP